MKVSLFLLFTCVFQLVAINSKSQNASINVKSTKLSVGELIRTIETQTDYLVVYSHSEVDTNKKVELRAKSGRVVDFLNDAFSNTDINHMFDSDYIILKSKSVSLVNGIAQDVKRKISGTVKDSNGEPLIGVTISVKGTTNGTITDIDGNFSLTISSDNALIQVSYVGYLSQELRVKADNPVSITLIEDTKTLDEVVVVGYGVQKKITLTGSVSAIQGKEVAATKNQNLQNMLTGKIPGLRIVQSTAEPGSLENSIQIRGLGSPLIVIDGVPRDNMGRLDPNDVESVSVLKDASAAVYGVRGANGVLLITTKKGTKDKLELQYSGNIGWQIPSGLPKTVNAIDYMTLRNEKTMHNIDKPQLSFTDEHFAPFLDGTKQSTDWYKEVIRSMAPQTQHTLSATGGGEKSSYYFSLGYQNQESFLRSNDLNYDRYNVRANLTSKIAKRITVGLSISGISEQTKKPYESVEMITRAFWRMKPTESVYANNNPEYYNSMGTDERDNPVAMMYQDVSGYNQQKNNWFQSTFDATYDVPYIEGLQVKGMFSYDYYLSDNTIFRKEYKIYEYESDKDNYKPSTKQAPNNLKREHFSRQNVLWNISLNYNHTFAKDHSVSGLLLLEQIHKKGDNFYALRNLSIPLDRLMAGDSDQQVGWQSTNNLYEDVSRGFIGRFNYAYQSKYLAEFSFRNDGSSKFPPKHRWAFFPSGSLGWRISEETFWKDSPLSFINNFKLRGSYGKMGDDGAMDYQFYSGYEYPAPSTPRKLAGGYIFDGKYVTAVQPKDIANELITWYEYKMLNVGVDFEAWNGLLGASFDIFDRNGEGLLATRLGSLPGVVGASLPQENIETDRNRGFELELSHRNKVNDLSYNLVGSVSFARAYWRYKEKAKAGNSYENWKDNEAYRWKDRWRAYESNGRIQSWNDIYNSPIYVDKGTLPGDYIYEDWNGDGIISSDDRYYNANGGRPTLSYGLTMGADYKNFDLNILLQGAALNSVSYTEQLRDPSWSNGGMLEQFLDRWHPVDPNADPYDPNLEWVSGHFAYTGSLPDENSKFNMQNASYLRLKSIELGYTIPSAIIKKAGLASARFYVNGYNLLTFTKLKYVDPEHPSSSWGYLYPLNKTFSVGVNIKF